MKRFLIATIFSILITFSMFNLVFYKMPEKNSLDLTIFISLIYLPPINLIGCIVGEGVYRLIKKVTSNIYFQYLCFLILGYLIALYIDKDYDKFNYENKVIYLIVVISSISFFFARSEQDSKRNERNGKM